MNSQKYQPPKTVLPSHKIFLEKVGANLKALREGKNVSIASLADEVEISRNSYSLMERGQIYFSTSNLFKVLDYYKLSPEDFFREL
jgi:transcriptional regulator with XRE-family HTH domain